MVDSVVAWKEIGNGDHVFEEVEDVEIALEVPQTDKIVSWLQHVQVGHRAARTTVGTRHVPSNRKSLARTITGVLPLVGAPDLGFFNLK